MRSTVLFAALVGWSAYAQSSGPALSVDASANRHAISPDIYGINFYWTLPKPSDLGYPAALAAAQSIRPTARRWGGNGTSTYHWKFDVNNIDADWFYEVLPDTSVDASKLPAGSGFNQYADQARTTGGKMLATIPILGWLPKARQEMCSFDVAKYGKQCKQDPYAQYHPYTCGDGIVYDPVCGNPSVQGGNQPAHPVYIVNDPKDAYAQFDETFQAQWIDYLLTRYGPANQGGIAIWSLDNEPIWWDNTHRDIHPNPYTYDELLSVDLKYAQAIKQADPSALIGGPVGDNWASLWYSKADIVSGWNSGGGWWGNPVDRKCAQRHAPAGLVSAAVPAVRTAARDAAVGLPGHACLSAGAEPGFHARVLGSVLRSQRRLLDRGHGQQRRAGGSVLHPARAGHHRAELPGHQAGDHRV